MDLVANPSKTRVVITMVSLEMLLKLDIPLIITQEHTDKKGNPKILRGMFWLIVYQLPFTKSNLIK